MPLTGPLVAKQTQEDQCGDVLCRPNSSDKIRANHKMPTKSGTTSIALSLARARIAER